MDIPDIDAYLQKMGVTDPELRKRVEAQLPGMDEDAVAAAMEVVAAEKEVAPLNAAARSIDDGGWGAAPALIVCADANGSAGGLEPALAALDMPVLLVKLPKDEALLEVPSLPDLARLALKALRAHVPASRRLIVAGVGFGAVVAHELALQVSAASDRVLGLVLLEGRHSVRPQALKRLPPARAAEVGQVATLLYPTVLAAAEADGARAGVPAPATFAARLGAIAGFDSQLDFIAGFRPHNERPKDWDARVNALLSRLAYFASVAHEYAPRDVFLGQTLAVVGAAGPQLGAVHAAWERISFLVQPIETIVLPGLAETGPTPRGAPGEPETPAAPPLRQELPALLWELVRRAEERSAQAEAAVQTPSSAAGRLSRRISIGGATASAADAFGPAGTASDPSSFDTTTLVLPLNRLCPERRYILRRATAVPHAAPTSGGTPAALVAPPLTRIPLWVVHGERGDISAAQKELAGALPLPAYGLAMGPDADDCGSLEELAQRYAAGLRALQPQGPYLLLGSSIGGALLAHALACALEAQGAAVGLVLVDGCVGTPALPLHDVSWYALFYLLREIGGLRGSMGEFVDVVRSAGSPSAQLKLLNSFRPPELADAEEAWDAAVYTTLDRAGLLKRLVKGPRARSPGVFRGPSATVLPHDRIGSLFLAATLPHLQRDALLELQIPSRHTECLLTDAARRDTTAAIVEAIKFLLPRL